MKNKSHNSRFFIKISVLIVLLITVLCSCTFNITYFLGNTFDNIYDSEIKVHFLDVGQGDCIFIELPDSRSMLIDAGVSGEGESIKEYINDEGFSKLDYLIATHPHADHIGSMAYIVENMDIGSIYMPRVSTTTKTYEKLLTAVSNKNYKIKSAEAGMSIIDEDNLQADIIAPVKIDSKNLNNSSVVLMITYYDIKFLFTGDAEKAELDTITDDISADVLKVGHHGSKTSTTEEFLQNVNPSYAVISCGKDNDYGHPHTQALKLFEKYNVCLFRTDQQGTIIISSDGKNIEAEYGADSIERK